jgi:hypothetical protein
MHMHIMPLTYTTYYVQVRYEPVLAKSSIVVPLEDVSTIRAEDCCNVGTDDDDRYGAYHLPDASGQWKMKS